MIKAVEVNARGSIQAIPCPQPPCGDVVASLGVTVAWPVGKCVLKSNLKPGTPL